MFKDVLTIARLSNGAGTIRLLYGELPASVDAEALVELCHDKLQMRKFGTELAVAVPSRAAKDETVAWVLWILNKVPSVTDLPKAMEELKLASAQFERSQNQDEIAPSLSVNPAYTAATKLAGVGRLAKRDLQTVLANSIVESGAGEQAAVLWIKRALIKSRTTNVKRAKSPIFSDQSLAKYADEIRHLCVVLQEDAPTEKTLTARDFSELNLSAALLAEMTGVDEISISLPGHNQSGLGVLVFAPGAFGQNDLRAVGDFYSVTRHHKETKGSRLRQLALRFGAFLSLALFVIYLLMPAPMRVSATAVSEPSRAISSTLPFEAFLVDVHTSIGDVVRKGDRLATFTAPQLEEQRNDIILQMKIEELTAQTSLAEQDYGRVVLSEQKLAAQQLRLAQIETRLGALELRAAADGAVISTIPKNITGSFVPVGTDVVVIQPTHAFDVKMDVARVDAPLLQKDQTGHVYFRGIANETYPIRVLNEVANIPDATTGEERLVLRGRVVSEDTARLIVGLSGFVKIDVDRRMRIAVWSRYVREYLREKAWIYLDWRS